MLPLSAEDPRMIGEFRLHNRLGAGGMGRVYLGSSPGGRAVAVKVIHPHLARDGAFLGRFRREVAAALAVNGGYAAPVVAAGPDDSPPWLATAYVPGPSLQEVVTAAGPLSEDAVLKLTAGLAEALRVIHSCGLVHRDLKPGNVLLAADGPRVIDFGVARALDGAALTTTGVTFGTASYMSPEQASGEETGPPSDVFSLGCLLCFAASGGVPFGDDDPPAVLYRVIYAPPELGAVPAGLRGLVAACLVKNPAERLTLPQVLLASAGAGRSGDLAASAFWPGPVAALIARYEAGLTGQAAALKPPGEPTGGAGVSLGDRLRSWPPASTGPAQGPPLRPPGTVPPPGRPGREPGVLSRRRALTGLAGLAAAAGLGVAGWELAGPGRGSANPQGRRASGPGTLLWSRRTGGQVTSGAARAGRAVYIGSGDGHVHALDAVSGRRIRAYPLKGAVTSAVTVAQGVLFAATANGKVHAQPVAGGDPLWTRALGVPAGGWPVVTNGVVYAGADDGTVYALHAGSGTTKWHYRTGGPVRPGPLPGDGSFGTQVYAGSDDGHVYALDVQTGQPNWKARLGGQASSGLAQAPARVFAGDGHGNLYDLDALYGSGQDTNWHRPLGGAVRGGLVTEQDTVYAGAADGSVHAVNIYGDPLWSYSAGGPVNSGLAVSGGTLYAGSDDGSLHAIDITTGTRQWRYLTGGPVRSRLLVAGRVVYFGSLDGSVYAVRA